jgi:hypothetical protein
MSTTVKRSFPALVQAPVILVGQPIFTAISYVFGRVFGCWHLKMSPPKTRDRESYRVCLRCGMHRAFDVERWKSTGRFYAPPVDRLAERRPGR